MKKVFVAMFGGTPARADMCMILNCAAGVFRDCEIHCYPIDKDTRSPNYINSKNLYGQYKKLRDSMGNEVVAAVDIIRNEDLFDDMLRKADFNPEEESIQYLLSQKGVLTEKDRRVLNLGFTKDEQEQNLAGGYYGRANIGAVTNDILISKGIYQLLGIYKEISDEIQKGSRVDVIIMCSSFGGTGASLGINFGDFLNKAFPSREKLKIHCIHIQPYFSFPDPAEDDELQINYKEFYAKSATVTTLLGERKNIVGDGTQRTVFDSFYYLGQQELDNISEKNSARNEQENKLHIIDMLVSLAVLNILQGNDESGKELYGYQYDHSGTDFISWQHMPAGIGFKTKHVNFMRFCAFMVDCMEPIFSGNLKSYNQEALIVHLYGAKGFLSSFAKISEEIDSDLRETVIGCCTFCRSFVQYWLEIENTARGGSNTGSITRFFNVEALRRVLSQKQRDFEFVRANTKPDELTNLKEYPNYQEGRSYLNIYDRLCRKSALHGIGNSEKNGKEVAGLLLSAVYRECSVHRQEDN